MASIRASMESRGKERTYQIVTSRRELRADGVTAAKITIILIIIVIVQTSNITFPLFRWRYTATIVLKRSYTVDR